MSTDETVTRQLVSYALPGRGDELRERMLAVAGTMRSLPGCEHYVVGRIKDEPEGLSVTERWTTDAASEAALAAARESGEVDAVTALMDPDRPPSRMDVIPLGGVGHLPAAAPGFTKVALGDVHDGAQDFGFGETGEARFATKDLGLTRTGLSQHVARAGRSQPFEHVHANAEEVYVVTAGSGTAILDGEEVPLRAGDALRVGPLVVRRFAGGVNEDLVFLAVGPAHPGDGDMTMLD